jgi:hypothetical protein
MNDRPETRAPEYGKAHDSTGSQAVVPAARARQAVIGHNVRYVLAFGLAAIVLAFIILYLIYFG